MLQMEHKLVSESYIRCAIWDDLRLEYLIRDLQTHETPHQGYSEAKGLRRCDPECVSASVPLECSFATDKGEKSSSDLGCHTQILSMPLSQTLLSQCN